MNTSFEPTNDRLVIALFLAFMFHAYVIYAVNFYEQAPADHSAVTRLEVTLVRFPSDVVPEKFDYLGDFDQRGGGESDDLNPPQEKSEDSAPEMGDGNMPIDAAPLPNPYSQDMQKLITIEESEVMAALAMDSISDEPPSPDELAFMVLEQRLEMAKIQDEIAYLDHLDAKRNADSELGSAAVKEALEAAYLVGWRERIEAQGNINYPREPRIQGLYGATDLEILIRADGILISAQVIKSSGHAALDDAAVRLVSQADYPPFSFAMRQAGINQLRFERRIDYSITSGVTSRASK